MADIAPHVVYEAGIAYLIAGCVLAAAFLTVGLDRIDKDARGSIAFRPLLVPGLVLLWPLVAARWIVLERRQG